MDRNWQLEERGQCRVVLSAPVLGAVSALSILWGWWCFKGAVALRFAAMLRPSELLNLTRRDLVFPADEHIEIY